MRAQSNYDDATGWVGWIFFAGIMLVLAGFMQSIAGLVAIFHPDTYIQTANHLVVFDYTQWGWVHLILGVILFASAASLFAGRLWGRIVGVTVASLSLLANFAFIGAYPFWTISIITLDVLVIYAIAVHGKEMQA
jgi:hypothetical protein